MNKNKIITPIVLLVMFLGLYGCLNTQNFSVQAGQTINKIASEVSTKPITCPQTQTPGTTKTYSEVSPLNIVAQPEAYLGKNVKFKAKFDKFSTLGLDYKPAFRSSEKFITLLILRPDVTNHDIPLSELKIFMLRETAEKHIDLNSGDEIEISGSIFSKALGDAWMNVDTFKVLKTTPKTDNK